MEHFMTLYEDPFKKILNGSKTIEIRLNDEKRRKVSVGDYITFSKLPEGKEKIKMEVIELYPYERFEELYKAFPFADFGCEGYSLQEMLCETYKVWSKERENEYGALGIRIKKP